MRQGHSSPVPIRRRQHKRVRQMADLSDLLFFQQHLNHIEPDFDFRIFQQPQVIECCLGKQPAFARVHRRGRARPILRRSRLHFYEDQAIAVAKNQIHFAARRAKVGREKFQAEPAQVFSCGMLADSATTQVRRE